MLTGNNLLINPTFNNIENTNNKKLVISIEGTDGSGKETQSKKLNEYFISKGYNSNIISFPQYNSESSNLVKKYLNGDFKDIELTPYQKCLIFSFDRFYSYITDWHSIYENSDIVIFDRYVESNILYNLQDYYDNSISEDSYTSYITSEIYYHITNILNLEYKFMGLPQPDIKIFLNMPYDVAKSLRMNRKLKNGCEQDINEQNDDLMKKVYDMSKIFKYLKFKFIDCISENNELYSINDIHNSIINYIKQYVK